MRAGFKAMESGMASIANEMRASVAALSTNLAERNKPQWQALGVAITFYTVIGGGGLLAHPVVYDGPQDIDHAPQ